MPSSRFLIASNTLGSSAASVTFSGIPATYTDLVIRASARTDRATTYDSLRIRPNNNSTSTNYSFTYLYGDGSSSGSYRVTTSDGYTYWTNIAADAASNTSNTFSSIEVYIPNYAGSSKKQISAIGAQEQNGTSAYMDVTAQLFQDTTAISSLVISAVGSFVSGSTFWLYGLKSTS